MISNPLETDVSGEIKNSSCVGARNIGISLWKILTLGSLSVKATH